MKVSIICVQVLNSATDEYNIGQSTYLWSSYWLMRVYFFIVFNLLGLFCVYGQSVFEKAQELTNQRSFEASSAVLIRYIDNHPQRKYDIARAWWLHSYNLLQSGQLEEALAANTVSFNLRKALRSTDAAYNYLRQSEINMLAYNYDAALNAAFEGMQLMIEDPLLYARLNMMYAKVLTELKRYDEAGEYLKTVLDIIKIELGQQHASYGQFTFSAGLLSLRANNTEQARAYFQQAFYANNVVFGATNILTKIISRLLFLSRM